MNVDLTIDKLNSVLDKQCNILDIGAGKQEPHAKMFRSKGHVVDTVDFFSTSTYTGNFMDIEFTKQYDVIWASHCLEHQLNVNMFLKKCYNVCSDGGLICITVPPAKDWIVGGHVTLWNAGLVIYNLVMSGFDCSNSSIKSYDYNISVIAQKKPFTMPKLRYDRGDLKTLQQWLPSGLEYDKYGHFEGKIHEYNWS